ncbi:unnamed protein product [Pleuronectes platessa]|uniref:Uncharacterized protein n=1 Tax=Pleuronectes platessa TaxID=8262 RepID=A0A9N7V7M7_PLEPL|nr:unnamed protein product [Pleuronectes platessa]
MKLSLSLVVRSGCCGTVGQMAAGRAVNGQVVLELWADLRWVFTPRLELLLEQTAKLQALVPRGPRLHRAKPRLPLINGHGYNWVKLLAFCRNLHNFCHIARPSCTALERRASSGGSSGQAHYYSVKREGLFIPPVPSAGQPEVEFIKRGATEELEEREEEGLMSYTADSHQGVMEILWLHYLGSVISSIFTVKCHGSGVMTFISSGFLIFFIFKFHSHQREQEVSILNSGIPLSGSLLCEK